MSPHRALLLLAAAASALKVPTRRELLVGGTTSIAARRDLQSRSGGEEEEGAESGHCGRFAAILCPPQGIAYSVNSSCPKAEFFCGAAAGH